MYIYTCTYSNTYTWSRKTLDVVCHFIIILQKIAPMVTFDASISTINNLVGFGVKVKEYVILSDMNVC